MVQGSPVLSWSLSIVMDDNDRGPASDYELGRLSHKDTGPIDLPKQLLSLSYWPIVFTDYYCTIGFAHYRPNPNVK